MRIRDERWFIGWCWLSDDVDSSDTVAASSDDKKPSDAAAADNSTDSSSLMLAENMETQEQPEQKLRAKRDLDADDIRELFASQRAPVDDYSLSGNLLNPIINMFNKFINKESFVISQL